MPKTKEELQNRLELLKSDLKIMDKISALSGDIQSADGVNLIGDLFEEMETIGYEIEEIEEELEENQD